MPKFFLHISEDGMEGEDFVEGFIEKQPTGNDPTKPIYMYSWNPGGEDDCDTTIFSTEPFSVKEGQEEIKRFCKECNH